MKFSSPLLMLAALFGLVQAVIVPTRAADELPVAPFVAQYTVYGKGVPLGEAMLKLSDVGDGRYRMWSDVRPSGLAALLVSDQISEQAEGEFYDGAPHPLRYEQQRQKNKETMVTRLEFDWRSNTLRASSNGDSATLQLSPRVVDPLSLHLLVMGDLQRGRAADAYTLVDDTELRTYQVSYDGEETLDTPLGSLRAVRISRHRSGSSRITRLWFAPKFDYLPVRITQYKNGEENLSMEIKQVDGR